MSEQALLHLWVWLKLVIALWFFYLVLRYVAGVGVGAPYFPVRKRDIEDAFTLVDVTEKDTVIDLGSGDGKILLACAKKGATVIGYELNPVLVLISRWRLRMYPKARIYWKNLFLADLSNVTKIFVFGLNPIMAKIEEKIQREARLEIDIISFAFAFPRLMKKAEKGMAMHYINNLHKSQ